MLREHASTIRKRRGWRLRSRKTDSERRRMARFQMVQAGRMRMEENHRDHLILMIICPPRSSIARGGVKTVAKGPHVKQNSLDLEKMG
jgi:hypothetical protein